MGFHYKIEQGKAHFVTLTVVDWIDVFTRENHKMAIVDSLRYCQGDNSSLRDSCSIADSPSNANQIKKGKQNFVLLSS
ncbi:MAG: hypothetical protein HY063_01540 [Bacteroidetes bacterium]|nr:hypothetical protein [Bacteroidota bacterium]